MQVDKVRRSSRARESSRKELVEKKTKIATTSIETVNLSGRPHVTGDDFMVSDNGYGGQSWRAGYGGEQLEPR